jgi:hypothetical protein
MSKGSAPPPPDYAGAAMAQGAANADAARATSRLSNPDFVNPLGGRSSTYGYRADESGTPYFTGNADDVYVKDFLSPLGQDRFAQDQRIDKGLGGLAETGLGFVQNTLSSPFDKSQLPERTVNAGQTGQDAIMSRLEPQITRRTDALENKLVNQGLVRGGEAFKNAMTDQGQIDNDLLIQAGLQGIGLGDQARSKAIQEEEFFRTEPLNILNAVRSASPVNMPQFQNFSGSNVAPAPIFAGTQAAGNAAQQAYNTKAGQDAMFMQGLMNMGGAVAGAPWAGKMFGF